MDNNTLARKAPTSGSEAESERDWPLHLFTVIVDCDDRVRRTVAVFAHTAEIARLACDASAKTPIGVMDARYRGRAFVAPYPDYHARTVGVVLGILPWGPVYAEVADAALDALATGLAPQDVLEHLGVVANVLVTDADDVLTALHVGHYVRLVAAAESPKLGAGLSEEGREDIAGGCDILGVTPHSALGHSFVPPY